jgi:hypothetical protein
MREGVRVTQDAAEALLTYGYGPWGRISSSRSRCSLSSGSAAGAMPPDLTVDGQAAGTATARARPGEPGPRQRGCSGSPIPALVDVGRRDAPLLWERAGARHQRQGGVRLNLHGASFPPRPPRSGLPCPAPVPSGGGETGSCLTATATCPRMRCRSRPCPPWLPPCEICTEHSCRNCVVLRTGKDA